METNDHFDLAIHLYKTIKDDQLKILSDLLEENGFTIYKCYYHNSFYVLIKFTKLSKILKEAENLRIQCPKINDFDLDLSKSSLFKRSFKKSESKNLDFLDPRIRIYENYQTISHLSLYNFIENFPKNINDIDEAPSFVKIKILNLFNPSEILRIKYYILLKLHICDLKIVDFLEKQKLLINIYPFYDTKQIPSNIAGIEQTFGQKISIYFEFARIFIIFLFIASIFGFYIFLNYPFIDKDSEFQIFYHFYSVFMIIWSVIFLRYWQNKEAELNIKWGTYGKIFMVTDKNKDFKGSPSLNLVTGLVEETFSKKKRFFLYIISFLETLPFLFIGIFFKICILTLKGFINEGELFYMESVGFLIKNKGILTKIPYLKIILDIIQNEINTNINFFYKKVCKLSTNRENHKTNQSTENSVIAKRFIFEFFNRFLDLAYLAYYKRNFVDLQYQLLVLFSVNQLRRIIVESIIPFVKKFIFEGAHKLKEEHLKKKNDIPSHISQKILELRLEKYDNFEDFLEISFQFAYILLFAGLFPHGSYIGLIFNIIEFYSDTLKLSNKLYRRPMPFKTNGIGSWLFIFKFISLLAIFSNSYIFAWSYYNYYFENFKIDNNIDLDIQKEFIWGKILLGVIIAEHLLFFFIWIIQYFYKKEPKWTRIFKKRQKFSS